MNIILRKEAIEYINKIFSFQYMGIEQDWELEMANCSRINEFISFYVNTQLSVDRKRALMALILASYDDLLNEINLDTYIGEIWSEIKHILESEKKIFGDLITYWSCEGEINPDNYFKLTPLIRKI